MTEKLRYIDRLFTFIAICLLMGMCMRPTLAQVSECGFDLIEQHRPEAPQIFERDFDEVHTMPIVVHVIHNSADPLGVGSNITDAQVTSMIADLNGRLEFNEHGDTGFRYCLANIDPDGNDTNGITRQTWSSEYDQNGVAVSGALGEPNGQVQSTFGWPWQDYYNIYVVTQILYNGLPNITGFAYFPISSYLDGTVIRYDRMVVGQTTLIHEIGHSVGLYHTFEGTTDCTPESNCNTQGDRVCDTNPAPSWSPCSNNCPAGYLPAPSDNYESYSQCRDNFTAGQIDRAHAISDNSFVRQSLYESDVCGSEPPPPDPELCDAPCPNDDCIDAIDLTECEPIEFCNTSCTDDYYDILVHPASPGAICGGTTHGNGQWYKFTTTEFGYWEMDIEVEFENESGIFGNYGEFNGVQWKLATGSCDSLEWMAASSCPTQPPTCFCGPLGPFAWAGPCEDAPCADPMELAPFWWTLMPPQFPTGDWLPYDPTRQEWHMTFPLPAGTYYFLLTGFLSYDFINDVVEPSLGTGTISICHQVPLSNKPVLSNTGTLLHWEGETATDWAVFKLNDQLEWVELLRTTRDETVVTEGGYYIVAGSTGFSNAIYLDLRNINEPYPRYDILGREGVKTWIKR